MLSSTYKAFMAGVVTVALALFLGFGGGVMLAEWLGSDTAVPEKPRVQRTKEESAASKPETQTAQPNHAKEQAKEQQANAQPSQATSQTTGVAPKPIMTETVTLKPAPLGPTPQTFGTAAAPNAPQGATDTSAQTAPAPTAPAQPAPTATSAQPAPAPQPQPVQQVRPAPAAPPISPPQRPSLANSAPSSDVVRADSSDAWKKSAKPRSERKQASKSAPARNVETTGAAARDGTFSEEDLDELLEPRKRTAKSRRESDEPRSARVRRELDEPRMTRERRDIDEPRSPREREVKVGDLVDDTVVVRRGYAPEPRPALPPLFGLFGR